MKLATKYQVDGLRQRVVDIVEESWPRSFEEWIRFRGEFSALRQAFISTSDGLVNGRRFLDSVPEPAAAIRLARDFDVPSILPFAFYTLAGITSDQQYEWDKLQRDDNSERLSVHVRAARWRLLDASDLLAVIRGREELASWMDLPVARLWTDAYTLQKLLDAAAGRCSGFSRSCRDKVSVVLEKWKKVIYVHNDGCPDPLGILETLRDEHPAWNLCPHCTNELVKHIRDKQRIILNRLNGMLGLQ